MQTQKWQEKELKSYHQINEYDTQKDLLMRTTTYRKEMVSYDRFTQVEINFDYSLIMAATWEIGNQYLFTINKNFYLVHQEQFNGGGKFKFLNKSNKRIIEYIEIFLYQVLMNLNQWQCLQIIKKEGNNCYQDFKISADDQSLFIHDNYSISLWKYQEDSGEYFQSQKIQIKQSLDSDCSFIRYSQPQFFVIHRINQSLSAYFEFSFYQQYGCKLKQINMIIRKGYRFIEGYCLSENLIIVQKQNLKLYQWNRQTKKILSIQQVDFYAKNVWYCKEKKYIFLQKELPGNTIQILKMNNQNQFERNQILTVNGQISDILIKENGELVVVVQYSQLTYFRLE